MAKKRKKKPPLLADYESLEAPGLTIERVGSFVAFKSHRTAEEQKALSESLQELHRSLPDKITEKAKRFEELARDFYSFDLLAAISLANLFTDPDRYVESEHKGSSLIVEYATLLILKDPYQVGKRLMTPEDLAQISELLKDIQNDLIYLTITRSANPERVGSPSELEGLQVLTQLHELGVRNPAYEQHLKAVLTELFTPFAESLVSTIGFDHTDALCIASAVGKLASRGLIERTRKAKANHDELSRAVERSRRGITPPNHLRKIISNLAPLSKKEAATWITNLAAAWVYTLAGDAMSFEASDIVALTTLEEARVEAFLREFSLSFGDVPADFYVPTASHQLKVKPLIRHETRYMCPVPGLLNWALKSTFEAALQRAKRWNRYEQHRHRFVLSEAVRLLQAALPSSEAHTELSYKVGGGESEVELDALITVDSAAILLEAKAGVFTTPAREGKAKRLERDLGLLVTEAHEQAIRAAEFLDSGDEVTFKTRGGEEVIVRREGVPHVFLVSVLLEPLGHVISLLRGDSQVLPARDRYVWSVSLHDLMVISELAQPFPLLLHYIVRRLNAIKQGLVRAHDELDLFGAYLDRGLYFDPKYFPSLDELTIGTFTDMFDAYYLHKEGKRRRFTKKPEPRMELDFRNLLEAAGRSGLPRRLDILLHLLNMDGESRKNWMRGVVETKRRFRKDARLHNFTQASQVQPAFGFTYFCGPEENDREELMERYCRDKMNQMGASGWLAIEDTQRTPGRYAFRRILAAGEMSLI